jgi:hypothetical protein
MAPGPIACNTLFYGGNLPILRDYIPDERINLVYRDPTSIPSAPTMGCSRAEAERPSGQQVEMDLCAPRGA